MAEISITKMSSKGQIVIPSEMRKGFKDKEDFVIIKSDKEIILKSVKDFEENTSSSSTITAKEAIKIFQKLGRLYGVDLAIAISTESNLEQITKAFKALALKVHPDKGGEQEHFKRLNTAYETLK